MVGAQTVVGTRTFTSQVASMDGATVNDMVKMSRGMLYSLPRGAFGIKGIINAPNGKITVGIYASNHALSTTQLIFEVSINSSSPTLYSIHEDKIILPPNYIFGDVHSSDPYILALSQFVWDYPGEGIISLKGPIPVTVVVTVKDATFIEAYLPGIGKYSLDFPWGHPCFGSNSADCNVLREFRLGNFNKPLVIPHRGYWGYDDTPEGGMDALKEAIAAKYWFSELNVRLSKDKRLVMLHDQEINRVTDLPATPDQCNPASVKNMNAFTTTDNSIPIRDAANPLNQGVGTYPSYPALYSGHLRDRSGVPNLGDPISDFAAALDHIQDVDNDDVFIIIDIQEKDLVDYLMAFYQCLKMAKDEGVLSKLIFKHNEFISRETLEEFLTNPGTGHPENLWSDYAYKTSTLVTIHPAGTSGVPGDPIDWPGLKTWIDDWMKLPSVIGFEVIFKCEEKDPMLSGNISPQHTTAFGGKSVVRFIKDMSYRTGNQWEIPTDCRGIPDGRGSWSNKSGVVAAPYNAYSPYCYDLRGNPEWLINPLGYNEDITPGFIITDRPDILQEMCEQLGRFNSATFRQ